MNIPAGTTHVDKVDKDLKAKIIYSDGTEKLIGNFICFEEDPNDHHVIMHLGTDNQVSTIYAIYQITENILQELIDANRKAENN